VWKLCVTRKLRRTDAAPSYVLAACTYGRNYEEQEGEKIRRERGGREMRV
jgi:hypothetical protein